MERKIIQIATMGVENVQTTQCYYITTALCNDGTIWQLRHAEDEWTRLPCVPGVKIKKL